MENILRRPDLNNSEFRCEKPFFLPAEFDEGCLLPAYQQINYPNPFVVTVYFGGKYGERLDPQLFNYDTLKLRMYEQYPKGDVFVLSVDSPCVFEVKTIVDYETINRKTLKRRSGDTTPGPSYSPLVSGLVIRALANQQFEYFDTKGNDEVTQELINIAARHQPEKIIPLAATAYKRSHYSKNGERLTIDRDLSYYECIQVGSDLVFVRKLRSVLPIVEVKHDQKVTTSYFEKYLMNPSIVPLKPNETKGVRLRKMLLEEQRLLYLEPELDLKSEEEWTVIERELKLDTTTDPREYLATLEIQEDDISLGISVNDITYQYFFLGGECSVCIMSRGLDSNFPRVIKYKKDIENKNGVLVREESVIPYSEKSLTAILAELGINSIKPRTSPIFSRQRCERKIYFHSSGNVYTVYADHCSVEEIDPRYNEKTWVPLDQIEIEYEGKIVTGQETVTDNCSDLLDNEFELVATIIFETATLAGLDPKNLTTRKYDWISCQS